jgi:hypothetical protein
MEENGHHEQPQYLIFVWSPSGWTLRQREGDVPQVGSTVDEGQARLRVSKIGPSPLPGDRRRCVFTELA